MILVTGASGKTGKTLVRHLAAKGHPVRALVHRDSQVEELRQCGAQEVVYGDMRQPVVMDTVVHGIEAIYHICPNMSADELNIGKSVIQAARHHSVRCLVYHSVIHSQVIDMPHHWQKMLVEEQIFKSHLNFTILQPAVYMQNIQPYLAEILEKGTYSLPYDPETRLSLIDLEDLAEAASIVLTHPEYTGGVYELCGTPAFTQAEVAEKIAVRIGKAVTVQSIAREDWMEQARRQGINEYAIQTLVKMFVYYEKYGMAGNPRILEAILKRPATSYEQFIDRTVLALSNQ